MALFTLAIYLEKLEATIINIAKEEARERRGHYKSLRG
jgi:hypothetical protein